MNMDPIPERTIKVSLESLQFPFALRTVVPTIVEQLVIVFTTGDLDRRSHSIPAAAEDQPPLTFGDDNVCVVEEIKCLHGQHRVAATLRVLPVPTDRWWYVDVYRGLTDKQR